MAKGRMLNRDVSLSLKFHALVNDTTRLLATWTIPHLDKHGVFHADPQIVKSLIFPLRQDLSTQEVAAMIDDLERVGLMRRFGAAGRVWQAWPGFADNQKGFHAERERTDFPTPPETSGKTPATAGFSPATAGKTPVEVQVQREREVQQEGAGAPVAIVETDPGPIPFSDPDPFTAAARRAGLGNQTSKRAATAKQKSAQKFDLGELENAPAIKVHRDVCGYVPITLEQARQIVASVNGDAETTWRLHLKDWMGRDYHAGSIERQLSFHETENKRAAARASMPKQPAAGRWQPGRGMYPQVPDPTPAEFAAAEARAKAQREARNGR